MKANLSGADLRNADLRDADLSEANLTETYLIDAHLQGAHLTGANLNRANLYGAHLTKAHLQKASLVGAQLHASDLSGANLTGANLSYATLVGTIFEGANLTGCSVYGISAWDVRLGGAIQSNLVITPRVELNDPQYASLVDYLNIPIIQVDNLEVAQFIYLLVNNQRIRNVIDTITSKVVLILGRFTDERKPVLDAIREELRKRDYVPILFDFEKGAKSLTDTVSTLAKMARFIIADLTDPSSVPHELAMIAPHTRVAVQSIILEGNHEYALFGDLRIYPWVLEPYRYESQELLLAQLDEKVVAPAEAKANELIRK